MGRKKTIRSNEIISLADEYRLENPNTKITYSKLGMYVRSKGYDVQDYTLRRDKELREYLDVINNKSDETLYKELVTYKTIDADAFILRNRNRNDLKEALINRDRYYARVAEFAVEALKSKKTLSEENVKLKELNEELLEKLQFVQSSKDRAELKEKDKTIKKLKAILKSYVYPDVANMLMENAGIGESVNSVLKKETVNEEIISADTSINHFLHNSVNKLLRGIDE